MDFCKKSAWSKPKKIYDCLYSALEVHNKSQAHWRWMGTVVGQGNF